MTHRPISQPTSATCATCAYYTPAYPHIGLCQPPTDRGGEPFAIAVRPTFIACHIYRKKKAST